MSDVGRLLAFVEKPSVSSSGERQPLEGCILLYDAVFDDELVNGRLIEDNDFSYTRVLGRGLMVFEGWVEVTSDPEPDVEFHGEWRRLTHWEMCRVREGLSPWA